MFGTTIVTITAGGEVHDVVDVRLPETDPFRFDQANTLLLVQLLQHLDDLLVAAVHLLSDLIHGVSDVCPVLVIKPPIADGKLQTVKHQAIQNLCPVRQDLTVPLIRKQLLRYPEKGKIVCFRPVEII